jgi:redox-sensitive bicupin YhaK (pirin superfamily)
VDQEHSDDDPTQSALLIEGRSRDLGGFTVRRLLPAKQRRVVGPFVFLDHMGPKIFAPGTGVDVRPHPHINLATVTYLFEGEIVHRDSLGSQRAIQPGAVNWMTAGRGIVHSERSGPEARARGSRLHGIQSWVALPTDHEEAEPAFHHYPASVIPEVTRDGARLRVIAGTGFGATSPVQVSSPTFYVEGRLEAGAELVVPEEYPERAAYVVEGAIRCGGTQVPAGTLGVWPAGVRAVLRAVEPSHVMLLGGAPLDGPRHIWWNFVSSSEARIERAKRDWREGRFPKVPGDEIERIPLPE